MDREPYERELKERQRRHLEIVRQLDIVRRGPYGSYQPCMHDNCPDCVGTGLRRDGSVCIHEISCPCPRCSPGSLSVIA